MQRNEGSQTKYVVHLHWQEQQSYTTTQDFFNQTSLLHIPPHTLWLNILKYDPTGVLYAMHIHKCVFQSDVVECACGQMP